VKLADKIREFLRRHDGTVKPWQGTDASLDRDMDYPPTMAGSRDRKDEGRRWFGVKASWRW
jgi:hypothetical protein